MIGRFLDIILSQILALSNQISCYIRLGLDLDRRSVSPDLDHLCEWFQSMLILLTRVKSGKFGHQVNSDTHLQTV